MNIAIFLSLGESFSSLKKQGQDQLMIRQNMAYFARHFKKVFIFSYQKETVKLPKNCILINPPFPLHRYLYALMIPFIHRKILTQADIIRCYQLSSTVPAIIDKFIFNKKYIFNLGYDYSAIAKTEGKLIQSMLFTLLQPLACHFADGILVKNKTLLPITSKLHAKYIYLPNGVNISQFKSRKVNRPKTPILLYVGRLEPQKNIGNLLKAVIKLKTKLKLVIIGQGSLYSQIIKTAKKYQLNFQLISKVGHQHLNDWYNRASIFILPSIKEGSPKVLFEAMASGLPCIVSNIPEHREIIKNNVQGILSSPSSQCLSQNIDLVLRSKKIQRQLSLNARKHIEKNFNIQSLMKIELDFIIKKI